MTADVAAGVDVSSRRAVRPLERGHRRGQHAGRRDRLRRPQGPLGKPRERAGPVPGHALEPRGRLHHRPGVQRRPGPDHRRAARRPGPGHRRHGHKNKRIDFNSRQIVLDAMGGDQPIPSMPGMVGSRFEVPALSLVIRDDGSVVVRNQARDLHDEVRKDMDANYKRELEESDQRSGDACRQRHDGGYAGDGDARDGDARPRRPWLGPRQVRVKNVDPVLGSWDRGPTVRLTSSLPSKAPGIFAGGLWPSIDRGKPPPRDCRTMRIGARPRKNRADPP